MLGYGPQCKWITLDADLSGWVVPVVSSVARVEVERGEDPCWQPSICGRRRSRGRLHDSDLTSKGRDPSRCEHKPLKNPPVSSALCLKRSPTPQTCYDSQQVLWKNFAPVRSSASDGRLSYVNCYFPWRRLNIIRRGGAYWFAISEPMPSTRRLFEFLVGRPAEVGHAMWPTPRL